MNDTATKPPKTFNEIEEVLKYLVENKLITGALQKSQLNYLQSGGGVLAEIKKHYSLIDNKYVIRELTPEPKLSSEESKRIAYTLLEQLGGNKFLTMTGSKIKYCDQYSSMYQLTKNKIGAKYMRITLNVMDLYDIEFIKEIRTLDKENSFGSYKAYNTETQVIHTEYGIYDDMLQETFTRVTGLYTSL